MADLQYTVNLDPSQALAALRALEQELSKEILRGRIKGLDVADQVKQLGRVRDSLNGMGMGTRLQGELTGLMREIPVVGRVFNALNGAAGPATAALSTVSVALGVAKKALHEWAAEETSITALNAALAATGQLSPAVAQQLNDLSQALSAETNIDMSAWNESLAVLTRLSGIAANELPAAAEAVKGLAGLTGTDLHQATMLYTRALNGSFEMLGRYGIKLDENASKEEKLAQLREKLAAGSGLLSAQTNTLAGSVKAFGLATQDAWQWLGKFLDKKYGVAEWFRGWARIIRSVVGSLPKIEVDTSGLKNNETDMAATQQKLKDLKTDADSLKDLGAGARDGKKDWDEFNKSLDATEKHLCNIAAAEKDIELARLASEETAALADNAEQPDTSKDAIRAQFAVRRAEIESRYANKDLELQQKTIEARDTALKAQETDAKARLAAAQKEQRKKADDVKQAEANLADVTPPDLGTVTRRSREADRAREQLARIRERGFDLSQLTNDEMAAARASAIAAGHGGRIANSDVPASAQQRIFAPLNKAITDAEEAERAKAAYDAAVKKLENAKAALKPAQQTLDQSQSNLDKLKLPEQRQSLDRDSQELAKRREAQQAQDKAKRDALAAEQKEKERVEALKDKFEPAINAAKAEVEARKDKAGEDTAIAALAALEAEFARLQGKTQRDIDKILDDATAKINALKIRAGQPLVTRADIGNQLPVNPPPATEPLPSATQLRRGAAQQPRDQTDVTAAMLGVAAALDANDPQLIKAAMERLNQASAKHGRDIEDLKKTLRAIIEGKS